MENWKELIDTCQVVLEEIDTQNVKAFYRKLIGYEKLSEIFKIESEYQTFKENFEGLEIDYPEFLPLLKRNKRNIAKHKKHEKKMYAGILGNLN